jgi:Ca2+-binding EF-hand superfamily protein
VDAAEGSRRDEEVTKSTIAAALLFLAAPLAAGDEPMKDGKPAPDTRTKAEVAADAKDQFTRADTNGDGYLKGDEIPKGWLERYDMDGDGRISRAEFMEISERPPKLRHLTPMRDPIARARFDMASFDKNKDGLIQKEEYPGDQVKFRAFDKNKDGALSLEEVTAMAEEEIAEIRKKMKNPNRYDFLVLFDSDKDNNVSLDEYDGPMDVFKKFDKDGDGVVTYDELYPEKMAERMKKYEETAPRPEDLTILETMDKNKDGKVERSEFKGTDDAWKRLDRNGDGVITIADAR